MRNRHAQLVVFALLLAFCSHDAHAKLRHTRHVPPQAVPVNVRDTDGNAVRGRLITFTTRGFVLKPADDGQPYDVHWHDLPPQDALELFGKAVGTHRNDRHTARLLIDFGKRLLVYDDAQAQGKQALEAAVELFPRFKGHAMASYRKAQTYRDLGTNPWKPRFPSGPEHSRRGNDNTRVTDTGAPIFDPPIEVHLHRPQARPEAVQVLTVRNDGFDVRVSDGTTDSLAWDDLNPRSVYEIHRLAFQRLDIDTVDAWHRLWERLRDMEGSRPYRLRAAREVTRLDPHFFRRLAAQQQRNAKPAAESTAASSSGSNQSASNNIKPSSNGAAAASSDRSEPSSAEESPAIFETARDGSTPDREPKKDTPKGPPPDPSRWDVELQPYQLAYEMREFSGYGTYVNDTPPEPITRESHPHAWKLDEDFVDRSDLYEQSGPMMPGATLHFLIARRGEGLLRSPHRDFDLLLPRTIEPAPHLGAEVILGYMRIAPERRLPLLVRQLAAAYVEAGQRDKLKDLLQRDLTYAPSPDAVGFVPELDNHENFQYVDAVKSRPAPDPRKGFAGVEAKPTYDPVKLDTNFRLALLRNDLEAAKRFHENFQQVDSRDRRKHRADKQTLHQSQRETLLARAEKGLGASTSTRTRSELRLTFLNLRERYREHGTETFIPLADRLADQSKDQILEDIARCQQVYSRISTNVADRVLYLIEQRNYNAYGLDTHDLLWIGFHVDQNHDYHDSRTIPIYALCLKVGFERDVPLWEAHYAKTGNSKADNMLGIKVWNAVEVGWYLHKVVQYDTYRLRATPSIHKSLHQMVQLAMSQEREPTAPDLARKLGNHLLFAELDILYRLNNREALDQRIAAVLSDPSSSPFKRKKANDYKRLAEKYLGTTLTQANTAGDK